MLLEYPAMAELDSSLPIFIAITIFQIATQYLSLRKISVILIIGHMDPV